MDFPNRPDRTVVSGGAVVPGAPTFPGTPSGLLNADYDTFTAEVDYAPSERVELGAHYTYEKDAHHEPVVHDVTQRATATLNNLLNWAGSDKGNTFGANALFHIVPDKWTWSMFVSDQKVDGLMDITAREAGAFYTPGRTGLIPPGQGGAADITDWDDTHLTTFGTQLDYHVAKLVDAGRRLRYEKYTYGDAYTSGTALMPQAVLIFMKPNEGNYTANVGYARLTYGSDGLRLKA